MRYHAWLFSFLIGNASSIAWPAGLSAAEGRFTLEEATIADIQEAVIAGALSSEKLVELYLARIATYDRAGPRLNSIIYINPNAKAEAAALDKERRDKGPRYQRNPYKIGTFLDFESEAEKIFSAKGNATGNTAA